MRILHTADWHMNNRLGRRDISGDILDGLRQIADILEREAVDVMIVAGDLFSERSSREQLRDAIGQIRDIFGPFLRRGGHIVAISGNHDSELFFETLRDTLTLGVGSEPRLHLAARPDLLQLRGKSGDLVQFALMPYPTARGFLRAESDEEIAYASLEERNGLLQEAVSRTLTDLRARLDPSRPAVLVSHVHVRGASSHTLYKVSEADDVIFDPILLGGHWDYVAYGHIHKPGEAVSGRSFARYCGSVARLDAAERHDEKGVVLVDFDEEGRAGEPRIVPLRAREIHQFEFNATGGLEELREAIARAGETVSNPQEALVSYKLHYTPGAGSLQAMFREIGDAFPLWYDRHVERVAAQNDEGAAIIASLSSKSDPTQTARAYLQELFSDHPDRDALLQRAEEVLSAAD